MVHMIAMHERLQEMSDVVKVAAESAQKRQKGYYDQHARKRVLSPGDKVLVLLPSLANKLKLEWVGPYQVLRRLNDVKFEVETPGRCKKKKVVHINLLKKWNEPQVNLLAVTEPKAEQTEEDNVNEPLLEGVGHCTSLTMASPRGRSLQSSLQILTQIFKL